MTTHKIRVVIAEDQRMVLGALAALLSLESDIEVVAQASDGSAALTLAREHRPDVLITDVEMPGMSGLDVARLVQGQTRVIVLTNFARAGYLRRALEAGVSGYVLKAQPANELADAVGSRAARGGCSPRRVSVLGLSGRELLKLLDSTVDAETDAFRELLQPHHVVRQEDHHRVVVGIGAPPTAVSTRPSHSAHAAAARDRGCVLGLEHHRDTHPEPVPLPKHRHAEHF
jgi:DNA-binding NarL/FixJ family response regulator